MSQNLKLSILCAATMFLSATVAFGQATKPAGAPNAAAGWEHHGALGVFTSQAVEGVAITRMIPGSPAERAGLRVGDEICSLANRQVRAPQELTELVRNSQPGSQVSLVIRRNGQAQMVTATVATYESTYGQTDSGLVRKSYSYEPDGTLTTNQQQSPTSRAQIAAMNQEVNLLNQQINSLNQQLNQVRSARNTVSSPSSDLDNWWYKNQRGEFGGDPAVNQ